MLGDSAEIREGGRLESTAGMVHLGKGLFLSWFTLEYSVWMLGLCRLTGLQSYWIGDALAFLAMGIVLSGSWEKML